EYGIWGLPTYFVIDAAGNVADIHMLLAVDPEPLGVWLRRAIDKCVAPSPTQSSEVQQAVSLIPDPGRTVSSSRGGSAQSFHIESAILKETRSILVVLPASYAQTGPDRRYPVTVVVDGEYLIAPVAAVSDELARNGQIPESVIVGIENVGGAGFQASNSKRVYDLTPPGLSVSGSGLNEGGDRFLDFIEQELLPAVDRQFRGSAPRTFVGVSSGGVLATYVAATRSTYRAVVSLDAPIHLGDNWLARKLTSRAAAPLVPVRYASLEAKFGWPEEAWKTLVATAPASWKLFRERSWPKESHESIGMFGAYLGLREVFGDYSMLAAPVAPTTSILPYYRKVGESLGATLIPPKKLLLNVAEDLSAEGRGAAAREAYNTLAFGYGAPADGAKLLARIAEVERRPPPTETVEGLLATPFPTPDEARAFIGEWAGDVWMRPEQPRTGGTTLRITVVDGRIVGTTVHRGPDGQERVQRWEYLKITPQGMTWGSMNGMRPRGVNLFEGKLEGDKLSGTVRFGGIDFRMPDGSTPEPLHFSFTRVRK
ncbi:MAG TPA: alpha/beta hydrolase-fold protein, partial [Blastocatellia bacterium]|nr:alpha/beta hydrolase-fold protein [Blastocatellia bacterium]